MSIAARLGLTTVGAMISALVTAAWVAARELAGPHPDHPVEAAIVFAMMLAVYAVLAGAACFVGNLLWMVLRGTAERFEGLALPALIALVYFAILSDAVRSTQFFEPGGRLVPSLVLFFTVCGLLATNSGKWKNV